MNPKVYLIVLNWNMYSETVECIESLKRLKYDHCKILIIDNASTDNSAEILKRHFSDIELIKNEQNFGFAEGNNIGIRHALKKGADYVFVLNNDVTLDNNCVAELIKLAENTKNGGMFAPKVYYYDYPKTINSLGTSIDWLRLRPHLGYCGQEDYGQFDKVRQADILIGCALLVRKDTVGRIGLIDERFFIFHEEADWCLRNIKSGFKNVVAPRAIAYHKASKTMKRFSALTTYYSIRNFLYLARKNASMINRLKTLAGFVFLVCKNFMFLIVRPELRSSTKAFLLGATDYFRGSMGSCKRKL